MLVFAKEKLVFLAMPKTGTTALESALASKADMVMRNPPILNHTPAYRYNRFLKPYLEKCGLEDMETVCVVRHPIGWLGSWYRYRARDEIVGTENSTRDITFDDFVVEYCKGQPASFANVGSQAKFLTLGDKSIGVNHLYKYEAMSKAIVFLKDRLKKDEIKLNRKNVSPPMALTISQDVEARLRDRRAFEFSVWDQGQD